MAADFIVSKEFIKPAEPEFFDEYLKMYPEGRDVLEKYQAEHPGQRAMAVKSVTIIVTENCNLRCSYCYQHAKNAQHVMGRETARRVVDLLFEEDAKENPYLNPSVAQALVLDFIGGEPLLAVELMDYFMQYFLWKAVTLNHRWAIHYMISISSNGTLMNTEAVRRFLALYKGRVSLGITIDGDKALHDACRRYPDGSPSYDIVAAGVRLGQQKYGVSRVTKLTLAPANVQYLFGAVKNLKESFDFSGVYANCVYEPGWTLDHARVLYAQMKELADWMLEGQVYREFFCTLFNQHTGQPMAPEDDENWCGGTGSMLCFTTEGNITPCLRYTRFNLNDRQPEIRIGNLETGIANAPEHKAVIEALEKIGRRSQSTDQCFHCPIAMGCAWCSAFNYEETGTPNKRVTYICPMHKARVLANVYYWNKLFRNHGLPDRYPMHVPHDWAVEIVGEAEFQALNALAADDACRPAML